MTAPTPKIFTVGMNAARIYALDTNGLPAATNATAYNGLSIGGPVTFTYDPPDPEGIFHPGNNMILQQDSLPSQEASSGTLEVSRTDLATLAQVTNTKVRQFGDVNSIGWRTNQQGTEPTVALIVYNQGRLPDGTRSWSTFVFSKSIIIPKPKGKSREQSNHSYFVQPQFSTAHLIGIDFTLADDGYTSTEVVEYQSKYRLGFAAWKVTAGETSLDFDSDLKFSASGSGGITVTKNGALMTYDAAPSGAAEYSADADGLTFGAALTNGDIIVAMYELADTAIDVD